MVVTLYPRTAKRTPRTDFPFFLLQCPGKFPHIFLYSIMTSAVKADAHSLLTRLKVDPFILFIGCVTSFAFCNKRDYLVVFNDAANLLQFLKQQTPSIKGRSD